MKKTIWFSYVRTPFAKTLQDMTPMSHMQRSAYIVLAMHSGGNEEQPGVLNATLLGLSQLAGMKPEEMWNALCQMACLTDVNAMGKLVKLEVMDGEGGTWTELYGRAAMTQAEEKKDVFTHVRVTFAWVQNEQKTAQDNRNQELEWQNKYREKKRVEKSSQELKRVEKSSQELKRVDDGSKNRIEENIIDIPPISPTGGGERTVFETWFEETFWKNYPRKTHKPQAMKAAKAAWKKVDADLILAALERDKGSDQWQRDGGKYVPYPASWLNAEPWEDGETAAAGDTRCARVPATPAKNPEATNGMKYLFEY